LLLLLILPLLFLLLILLLLLLLLSVFLTDYFSSNHSRLGQVALRSPREEPLGIAGALWAGAVRCPPCHPSNSVKTTTP